MGKVIDFMGRFDEKRGRAYLKGALEEYIDTLKAIAPQVETMSGEKLIAVFGTLQIVGTSITLQKTMDLRQEGADVTEAGTKLFQALMSDQMALGYFYATQLGIDTREAFENITE